MSRFHREYKRIQEKADEVARFATPDGQGHVVLNQKLKDLAVHYCGNGRPVSENYEAGTLWMCGCGKIWQTIGARGYRQWSEVRWPYKVWLKLRGKLRVDPDRQRLLQENMLDFLRSRTPELPAPKVTQPSESEDEVQEGEIVPSYIRPRRA